MHPPLPRSPRPHRFGLRLISGLTPDLPAAYRRPRACDDEALIRHSTIYAIPVWEISSKTGMVRLYQADPATGRHILDRDGRQVPSGEVPHVGMARHDAQPRIVIDYVGQTIRPVAVREGEHAETKCWDDIIAAPVMIIAEGQWKKAERDRREIAAIAELKPRFNKEYNEGNPHRIEIWRQVQLRHARDDASKRARWMPLEQRTTLALRTAALDVVAAGLDGREPRYPLTVLGRGLARSGRWMWARPATRMAALTFVLWASLLVGAQYALRQWGWPASSGWLGAATASGGVFFRAEVAPALVPS
jgi:hypothetical protein